MFKDLQRQFPGFLGSKQFASIFQDLDFPESAETSTLINAMDENKQLPKV